jgi:hypothetical protein
MVLVRAYQNVKKAGARSAVLKKFTPLRAVGMSVEQGWKAARDKGCVEAADLQTVRLSGDLRVTTGNSSWRSADSCMLELRSTEVSLAEVLVAKQRRFMDDLHLNVWQVDVRVGGATLDLRANFNTNDNFGIKKNLWTELKVFSAASFAREATLMKSELVEKLGHVKKRDSSVEGVLLLAAKVERSSGGRWGAPTLSAWLHKPGDTWKDLTAGRQKVARGQAAAKPKKAELWKATHLIDWLQVESQTGCNQSQSQL